MFKAEESPPLLSIIEVDFRKDFQSKNLFYVQGLHEGFELNKISES